MINNIHAEVKVHVKIACYIENCHKIVLEMCNSFTKRGANLDGFSKNNMQDTSKTVADINFYFVFRMRLYSFRFVKIINA